MAGYESPWEAMGKRDDGYTVLDPRDFRSKPPVQMQPARQQALEDYRAEIERSLAETKPIVNPDPWSSMLGESDAHRERKSAESAWVDSYLRSESGAAIPIDERRAYTKMYFPQPGDSPEHVRRKKALRAGLGMGK